MRFFNDQRIQTIHRGVIKPGTRSVKVQEYTTESGIVVVPDDLRAEVWEFENIKKYIPDDNGNVGRLCDQYVFELSRLLLEWLKVREDNGLKS